MTLKGLSLHSFHPKWSSLISSLLWEHVSSLVSLTMEALLQRETQSYKRVRGVTPIISFDNVLLIEGQPGVPSQAEKRWSSSPWRADCMWPFSDYSLLICFNQLPGMHSLGGAHAALRIPFLTFWQLSCGRVYSITSLPFTPAENSCLHLILMNFAKINS